MIQMFVPSVPRIAIPRATSSAAIRVRDLGVPTVVMPSTLLHRRCPCVGQRDDLRVITSEDPGPKRIGTSFTSDGADVRYPDVWNRTLLDMTTGEVPSRTDAPA